MTDGKLNLIERIRVYAQTNPSVQVDSKSMLHILTLAEASLGFEKRNSDLKDGQKELAEAVKDFVIVQRWSKACLFIGVLGAVWGMFWP